MKVVIFLIASMAFVNCQVDPLSDEFIDEINRLATSWTAGRNFHQDFNKDVIKGMMGVHPDSINYRLPEYLHDPSNYSDLPPSFDARTQWPSCVSLNEIRDQGSCGGCWAFATSEVMSDRICIKSNGANQVKLSAQNLISCCRTCGFGCGGGFPPSAFTYWMKTGVVTGGAYGSDTGCMPYEIPPCQHNGIPGPRSVCNATVKTPACSAVCTNKAFPNTIVTDRRMGSAAYSIANDALQIQTEIFTNGPVVAVFTVYDDFIQYQSGVYQYTTGSALGGHAIKIIGWGVEDGLNYWLVSNSWNSDWGSQSGFFKILRGVNHCGIEAQVSAGLPK